MEKTNNISTKTLIIGAGFCGRAVASVLGENCIVIDSGEPFSYESIPRNIDLPHKPILESVNRKSLEMGFFDSNWQSYVLGGNSNWWGGWASRISDDILKEWVDPRSLDIFYDEAEKLLNVHGDIETFPSLVGEIPGAKFWKGWASKYFGNCHVTSETKNFTLTTKGMCLGRGTCWACPENAKTMPGDIHVPNLAYSTRLVKINHVEGIANSALVADHEGEYEIFFDNIVIAAGGYDNVSIAKEFFSIAGSNFQDHTSAEFLVKFKEEVPYRKISAESHVELEELRTTHAGIEAKVLLLTTEPSINLMQKSSVQIDETNRKEFGQVWVQIEIPPAWNLVMKNRGDQFYVDYTAYFSNLHFIDQVIEEIERKLSAKTEVCAIHRQYRYHYGGFHLSGTTPIGSVVDENCKIVGTQNIYVAGASVIPRAGGSGPSLTAVALSLKLGGLLSHTE